MSVNLSFYSSILYCIYTLSNIYSFKHFNSIPFFIGSSIMYFSLQYELTTISHNKKKMYLIRGFPGCGKSKYIENKFKNDKITLFDNYDLKTENHENLYILKERKFLDLFKCIYSKSRYCCDNIVISGFFPNENSIINIKYLCDLFKYKLIIISFESLDDKDQVKYLLNRSSIRQFNKSYIFKHHNSFEDTLINYDDDDYNEIFIDNFNDCPGDSIPYPKKTLEELDLELDKMKCKF